MTVRWARENIATWLKELDPETVVLMFGSNDVRALELDEYEKATREVVEACLQNGTVAILTTPPPQSDQLEKCLALPLSFARSRLICRSAD
jgi:hypothetical protein